MNLSPIILKPRPTGKSCCKIAIFGDVHSNIEALDSVLTDMRKIGITRFFCTGDVVGYGADPSACIQRLRRLNVLTVKGNHDQYSAGGILPPNINSSAKKTILWTKRQLTTQESRWLLNLPTEQYESELGVTHSTFEPNQKWPYIFDSERAEISLYHQKVPLAFFGHTHDPMAFIQTKNGHVLKQGFEFLRVEKVCRYFINPGSVGQPRDGNPRAAYAIYDPTKQTITLRRIEYDVKSAAAKIIKAGLPSDNAKRLTSGK